MQNDETNLAAAPLVPSVDETTATLEKEEAEQDAKMQGSSPQSVESTAFKQCIYATKIVRRRKIAGS
jgi:hypothetical protein